MRRPSRTLPPLLAVASHEPVGIERDIRDRRRCLQSVCPRRLWSVTVATSGRRCRRCSPCATVFPSGLEAGGGDRVRATSEGLAGTGRRARAGTSSAAGAGEGIERRNPVDAVDGVGRVERASASALTRKRGVVVPWHRCGRSDRRCGRDRECERKGDADQHPHPQPPPLLLELFALACLFLRPCAAPHAGGPTRPRRRPGVVSDLESGARPRERRSFRGSTRRAPRIGSATSNVTPRRRGHGRCERSRPRRRHQLVQHSSAPVVVPRALVASSRCLRTIRSAPPSLPGLSRRT